MHWTKLDIKGELPKPRIYHSSAVCLNGIAKGMMVIFGGRGKNGKNFNDMWGLRKHRNGVWDWIKSPNRDTPHDRIQHTSLFCGNFFIIIGGKSEDFGDNLSIEVFNTENSEWSKLCSFRIFRHSSFIHDNFLYIYGGLKGDNIPTNNLIEMDLFQLFSSNQNLLSKLKFYFDIRNEQNNTINNNSDGNNYNNNMNINVGMNNNNNIMSNAINNKKLKGVKPKVLDSLEVSKMKNIYHLEDDKKKCIICLEDFKNGNDVIYIPCLHVFHKDCLLKWFKGHNFCPICKFKLTYDNME